MPTFCSSVGKVERAAMKIAIDGYNISFEHGTGVATYGRNLVRAGHHLGHETSVLFGAAAKHSRFGILNEVSVVGGDPLFGPTPGLIDKANALTGAIRNLTGSRRAREVPISGQVILPLAYQLHGARFWNVPSLFSSSIALFHAVNAFTRVRGLDADLVHWTYPLPVRAKGAVNVYTLHDLVPLRLPYTTLDRKRAYHRLCRRICQSADHILTVSECSRRDIVEILGADERRVTNLYQSSDIANQLAGIDEAEIARAVEGVLGVGLQQYFLFFGAIEPKKNVGRLIEAYLSSSSATPLVIVGAPGWGGEKETRLLNSISKRRRRKRVIWLNFVPRKLLAMLIAGARATLFPSLYEGFGLPVLESMTLGTPVLTSNVSSLPEVAGEAALLVDPYEVHALSRAIIALDSDEGLRRDLGARGRSQAARFSDESYRQRLSGFYADHA